MLYVGVQYKNAVAPCVCELPRDRERTWPEGYLEEAGTRVDRFVDFAAGEVAGVADSGLRSDGPLMRIVTH
jgi:hypothetical protein